LNEEVKYKAQFTSSPVGQTTLDAVTRKFVRVGSSKNVIALELGVDDLANDVLVGETDNQSVLGRVVLVLGLNNQTLASVVVGLTLCELKMELDKLFVFPFQYFEGDM
jgi:hypothetical protein